MTTQKERLMDDYLERLHHSLRDIPASQRETIISEIVTHIDDAFDAEPDDSEASLRNVLERVGDPEEIASEARDRFEIPTPTPSWRETAALVLLLVGGFLYFIGWIVGVVLLWSSDVWSTRQKIIGTLVVPGGLFTALFLFTVPVSAGEPSDLSLLVGRLLFVVLIVAPIATCVYLGRSLSHARGGPMAVEGKQPMVRKEWLIAMAIVFVSLMALVFTVCGGAASTG
jgi:hypothetical protein